MLVLVFFSRGPFPPQVMFWKTTEFDFEPTEQYEGKTVQAQCSVKKDFFGWVTNRDFKRLVSLHFDLSGGAAVLGIYDIKEDIKVIPPVRKTNPLVTDSVAVVVVVVVVVVIVLFCLFCFVFRSHILLQNVFYSYHRYAKVLYIDIKV